MTKKRKIDMDIKIEKFFLSDTVYVSYSVNNITLFKHKINLGRLDERDDEELEAEAYEAFKKYLKNRI